LNKGGEWRRDSNEVTKSKEKDYAAELFSGQGFGQISGIATMSIGAWPRGEENVWASF